MLLFDTRGKPKLGHTILKSALRALISKFGIFLINDKISEIFTEESEALRNYAFDDIAELYDNINKFLRLKDFVDKPRS